MRTAHEIGRPDVCVALLFRGSAPPDPAAERLLEELSAWLNPARDRLLAALDAPPGGPDAEWFGFLARVGRSALHIDSGAAGGATSITLDGRPVEDLLDAVRAAVVPGGD